MEAAFSQKIYSWILLNIFIIWIVDQYRQNFSLIPDYFDPEILTLHIYPYSAKFMYKTLGLIYFISWAIFLFK